MGGLNSLDLNLLVALDCLFAERNVTRAAESLGLSQSAMSHKLRRLREQLNDPLLVKGSDGFVLTPRASAMVEPLRRALQGLETAIENQAPFDPATDSRDFVLAATDLLEFCFLPKLLMLLSRDAPGVSISVTPIRGPRLIESLHRGEVDLAFGVSPPQAADIVCARLGEEPLVVMGRRGHPLLVEGIGLDAYAAAGHVLIAPGGRAGGLVDDVLRGLGRSRRIVVRVAHFVTAPFLLVGTDLLLTAPQSVADTASRYLDLDVRPVPLDTPNAPIVMSWHARFQHSSPHRWLRDLARREFESSVKR